MKTYKRIILVALLVTGVAMLLVFSHIYQSRLMCKSVVFEFSEVSDSLLTSEELTALMPITTDSLCKMRMSTIDVGAIESSLESSPYTETVEVFTGIFGKLRVAVKLRQPIARFQFQSGPACFVDRAGVLMPVVSGKASYTLIVSGFIPGSYSSLRELGLANSDSISASLPKLFSLTKQLVDDPFFSTAISQLWFSSDGELVISPIIGHHFVEFGDLSNVKDKLFRLKVFYTKGITDNGWRDYRKVSVKYDKQIVCSKK